MLGPREVAASWRSPKVGPIAGRTSLMCHHIGCETRGIAPRTCRRLQPARALCPRPNGAEGLCAQVPSSFLGPTIPGQRAVPSPALHQRLCRPAGERCRRLLRPKPLHAAQPQAGSGARGPLALYTVATSSTHASMQDTADVLIVGAGHNGLVREPFAAALCFPCDS